MCDAGAGEENSEEDKFPVSTTIAPSANTVETVLGRTIMVESGRKISSLNKKGESDTKPPSCVRDLTKNHGISATKKKRKRNIERYC